MDALDAIARARSGAPLGDAELMAITGLKKSAFYVRKREGRFDRLRIKGAVGRHPYSGTLVARWLDGDFDPVFIFGNKRLRGA